MQFTTPTRRIAATLAFVALIVIVAAVIRETLSLRASVEELNQRREQISELRLQLREAQQQLQQQRLQPQALHLSEPRRQLIEGFFANSAQLRAFYSTAAYNCRLGWESDDAARITSYCRGARDAMKEINAAIVALGGMTESELKEVDANAYHDLSIAGAHMAIAGSWATRKQNAVPDCHSRCSAEIE